MLIIYFGPPTRVPKFSTRMLQLFFVRVCTIKVNAISQRMLRVCVSQVQFSRSWSQDFETHDHRSQVRRFQFQGPGSHSLVKVSGLRVTGLRVSGLRFTGLRVPGGSQVLILDYAMKWVGIFQVGIFWVGIFRVGIFPGGIFLEPALSQMFQKNYF